MCWDVTGCCFGISSSVSANSFYRTSSCSGQWNLMLPAQCILFTGKCVSSYFNWSLDTEIIVRFQGKAFPNDFITLQNMFVYFFFFVLCCVCWDLSWFCVVTPAVNLLIHLSWGESGHLMDFHCGWHWGNLARCSFYRLFHCFVSYIKKKNLLCRCFWVHCWEWALSCHSP